MDKISFKSGFKTVTKREFIQQTKRIGSRYYVSSPWTIKESVINTCAYTKNVHDCTVIGITDGEKVFLLHLCPTKEDNKNFEKIANFIKSKIDSMNKTYLQAFVAGSKNEEKSLKLFDNIINFLKENKISTTFFKECKEDFDIAYNAIQDEWLLSSICFKNSSDSLSNLTKNFKKIHLSALDTII